MAEWVAARAKCSVVEMLERLRGEVRSDVKVRNNILDDSGDRDRFRFVSHDAHGFAVTDSWSRQRERSVTATVDGNQIVFTVVDGKNQHALAVSVTLDDDLKCRFKVDDQSLEPWQVSKRALESLFFDA